MSEQYSYPPLKILFPYSLILIMSMASVYFWFIFGRSKMEFIFSAIYWLFNFMIAGPACIWIANNLSVQITVDEHGISRKSFLGLMKFKWDEIKSVQWRILYEGGHDDLRSPSDISIQSREGRKMQIYGICSAPGTLDTR